MAVSERQKRAVHRGVWGVKGGWVHWEWNVLRPERYSPYNQHWGVDVAPGDVSPHEPHGPASYTPDEGRWGIKAPMNGTVIRSHGNDQVDGFFNDTLIEYRVRSLDYPISRVYVLYGHLKPDHLLPANAQVGAGDVIGLLGDKRRSLGEIIHTHVQVWFDKDDALNYNHPATRDPMVLWRAIEQHVS